MVDKDQRKTDDKGNHEKKVVKIALSKIIKPERFILKRFKLSVSLGGHSKGSIIRILCHKKTSVPKERYWRHRLRDSVIDGCMTAVD